MFVIETLSTMSQVDVAINDGHVSDIVESYSEDCCDTSDTDTDSTDDDDTTEVHVNKGIHCYLHAHNYNFLP